MDQGYVSRLLDLSGGSVSDLRALDVAFIVKVRSTRGEELVGDGGEGFEVYICSPVWMPKVRDRVLKAVKIDYSGGSKLAEETLSRLLEFNRRLYSYLKMAYTHGARVAWESRALVQELPGYLASLKPYISLTTPDSIPAINYALRDIMLKAMDAVEGRLIGGGGGEGVDAIILEALPARYRSKPEGVLKVKPRSSEDVELAKLMASKLNLEVAVEGGYILLKPGG